MLQRRLDHLDGAEGRHRPGHALVSLDERVLAPQLQGVEAELGGELVDERLDGEGRGRGSRPPVGTEREAVRLHAVAANVDRLPPVRAGDEQRRDPLDAPARVRAAVDDHPAADARQRAVLLRADLELGHLRRGGVRGREVLLPRHHEANGPAQRERRARGQRLDEGELPAERATERLGDDADPVERQAVRARELRAADEDSLGRDGDGELAVGLEPGRRRLRLEVRLVDPRRPERPGDDGVARGEGRVRVSARAMDAVEDVARQLLVVVVLAA